MRLVTTDAIVLRTYNLAESDRIVVCLTRAAGLGRGVAKGARRMKSRFGAALEPFTVVRLAYHEKENRDLVSISSAEILKSHFELNVKPETGEVLAYMGELINEFAPPHEADERMFRMLSACLDALGQPQERNGNSPGISRSGCCDFRGCFRICALARNAGLSLMIRLRSLSMPSLIPDVPGAARMCLRCFLMKSWARSAPATSSRRSILLRIESSLTRKILS
jgi:hypothetical protein